MLRIVRHQLGPRVFVLGMRIHEWHLGAAILIALAVAGALERIHENLTTGAVAFAGLWLIAKDWHDLVPSSRDTTFWRLGLHLRPTPLRVLRRADPLPQVAALAAGLAALVNLASAARPNIAWRHHALLQVEPFETLRLSHAAAVPASFVLFVTAFYLSRRRQGAFRLALALLLALGVLNLLKGLAVEEAAASFAVAGILWLGRGSFSVRPDPVTLRSALWRVPLLTGGSFLLCLLAVRLGSPENVSLVTVVRETGDALLWQPGPLVYHDELGRLAQAVGAVGVLTLLWSAYLLFRPLAAPRALPNREVRRAAGELVRRHGADTLAYFKLRRDEHYLFGPDRLAFLGYRVESRVLLVSGDPVGPDDAIPDLLRELSLFAQTRGLHIAALGVGERLRPLWEQLGLRALYLGDEAIVRTGEFSLEGRAIRKVRQSLSRLDKQGYAAELYELRHLGEREVAELERVSEVWREGAPERGFVMSLDALRREDHGDSVVVLARDGEGQIRGFLHFAPSYGRAAMSLSAMRRDRRTPNGLIEFLVVRAIELLRERGVAEVSLNFAAFARVIHSPRNPAERLVGRVLCVADAVFQIERLYRFNAKFFPRWEPRYLMYEGLLGLPRAGLAALLAEGQLPKPALRR
ncbi:MAG TPA: phosphatidylglycerol lysyltransferase domain-containing protein [Gaiellaceae bacterium]